MADNVITSLDMETKVVGDVVININITRDVDELSEDGKADAAIIHAEFSKTIKDAIAKVDNEMSALFDKELVPKEEKKMPIMVVGAGDQAKRMFELLKTLGKIKRKESAPYSEGDNPFKGCQCKSCTLLSDLIEDKEVTAKRIEECDPKVIAGKLSAVVHDGEMDFLEALRISTKIRSILDGK